MKSWLRYLRPPASPATCVAALALIAIVLPPILCGPWIPFLDLVAFVGLDNYPVAESYGPLHYGVFQFTYVVHYALSRAMLALSISPATQVVLFYLLQALVFFFVIWRVLERLVPEIWVRGMAVAVGTLAFWDGFFIWGGPLPFSLAATSLAAATLVALREVESPEEANPLLVPLLSFLSVMCHPFALPFALLLSGLRWIFSPHRRIQASLLLGALLVLGWIIRNDSPESGSAANLTGLFTWPWTQVHQRLFELFIASESFARQLFGSCPSGLRIYFYLLGAIHLIGFLVSPVVAVLAREHRTLRMLATLNTVVAILYLCSRQHDVVIPGWPWRILTFNSPCTFLAGVVGPLFLLRRWRPSLLERAQWSNRARWVFPVGVVALIFALQFPLLRLGENIERSLRQTRATILKSGIANAFVVVSNVDSIQPFYLRCVPFLLFSDPALVTRNLLLYTEWHIQDRHPTRLAESWFDLGRAKFQASFSSARDTVQVEIRPQAAREIPLPIGNNQGDLGGKPNLAMIQFGHGNRLMQLGCIRDAILHYESALRIAPEFAAAHSNLGVACLAGEQRVEAMEKFRTALRIDPNYVDAHANLGAVLLQLGRQTEAIECFQRALRLNPHHPAALSGLQRAGAR